MLCRVVGSAAVVEVPRVARVIGQLLAESRSRSRSRSTRLFVYNRPPRSGRAEPRGYLLDNDVDVGWFRGIGGVRGWALEEKTRRATHAFRSPWPRASKKDGRRKSSRKQTNERSERRGGEVS